MVSMEGVMAEREGFEPSLPFGKRALQARALDRTMRPLQFMWKIHPRSNGRDYTIVSFSNQFLPVGQ